MPASFTPPLPASFTPPVSASFTPPVPLTRKTIQDTGLRPERVCRACRVHRPPTHVSHPHVPPGQAAHPPNAQLIPPPPHMPAHLDPHSRKAVATLTRTPQPATCRASPNMHASARDMSRLSTPSARNHSFSAAASCPSWQPPVRVCSVLLGARRFGPHPSDTRLTHSERGG